MIYDKVQHCDLVYSENQEVGRYNSDFTREYMLRRSEQVREANNGKPVVLVNNFKEFGIGALGLIISLIIAFVLTRVLPCGRHLVFHMGVAFLCGYIGLMKIRSNKSYDKFSYTKDKLAETIAGVLLIVEAIAILVMWFNLPFATDWECSYFMAGIFLFVMAAYKAVRLVFFLTRSIRIYTREIEAECIGYVRLRTESTDSDNHTHIHWHHSPVFKRNFRLYRINRGLPSYRRFLRLRSPSRRRTRFQYRYVISRSFSSYTRSRSKDRRMQVYIRARTLTRRPCHS